MTVIKFPTPDAEQTMEQELQAMGLTAPRVTPAMIDAMIERVEFVQLSPSHTICKLYLFGGRFHMTGESATVSVENFNAEKAEEISYRKARDQVWPIAGAVLAHELHNHRLPLNEEQLKLSYDVQLVMIELNQVLSRLKSVAQMTADLDRLRAAGADEEEITLLVEQQAAMLKYSQTLQKRLARIGL